MALESGWPRRTNCKSGTIIDVGGQSALHPYTTALLSHHIAGVRAGIGFRGIDFGQGRRKRNGTVRKAKCK
jgi:hypothetical protein